MQKVFFCGGLSIFYGWKVSFLPPKVNQPDAEGEGRAAERRPSPVEENLSE